MYHHLPFKRCICAKPRQANQSFQVSLPSLILSPIILRGRHRWALHLPFNSPPAFDYNQSPASGFGSLPTVPRPLHAQVLY
ncbi:hypothetical protein K1719_011299 [Acacia pycnantha]|nr:hypothetical protein K1719_011299 [Acacia pycnantha]